VSSSTRAAQSVRHHGDARHRVGQRSHRDCAACVLRAPDCGFGASSASRTTGQRANGIRALTFQWAVNDRFAQWAPAIRALFTAHVACCYRAHSGRASASPQPSQHRTTSGTSPSPASAYLPQARAARSASTLKAGGRAPAGGLRPPRIARVGPAPASMYSGERLAGMGESDSGRVYSPEEGRPEAGSVQARRAHRMAAAIRLGREERRSSGAARRGFDRALGGCADGLCRELMRSERQPQPPAGPGGGRHGKSGDRHPDLSLFRPKLPARSWHGAREWRRPCGNQLKT
jgi:hypothetical protein